MVRGSEGFDALSFLSPLSGDPFYLDYYRDQVAAFAPLMPADTMATLKAIVQRAQAAKILFSPFLDLRFSAGPDQTIDDFLASAAEPDARLMRGFRASPYWHDFGERLAAVQGRSAGVGLNSVRDEGRGLPRIPEPD